VMSVQIKIISEKIAIEASSGSRWRPPLLAFHIGWCFIFP
jgi:hypothetical protein